MKKRFFDCDIWDDEWFMNLPEKAKLLWLFMLAKCDNAGIWEPNWKLATFMIGTAINAELLNLIGDERVCLLPNGRVLIKKFIRFQYGELSEASPPHKHVKKILLANGIATNGEGIAYPNARVAIPLPQGKATLQDKDKDKDKDKEGDARGRVENNSKVEQASPNRLPRAPATAGQFELYASKIGLPMSELDKYKDHYEGNGWKIGRVPMRSWEAAMRNWKRRWEENREKDARCKKTDPDPGYDRYMRELQRKLNA